MSSGTDDLVVSCPLGKVRGHRDVSRSGRSYLAFSGLPYAKPPVGDLVFQPPEPAEPWTGVRDALEDGPWCIQFNMFQTSPKPVGELDCLYLSLYTHDVSGNFPVVVRFHGGGFISGNGPRKTGPQYLMDEDVLVVMVNYRVGIYGFLSFEDEDMPGNQGLKDQAMSLRWIQENISSFGGDPNRVTIVGDSAGGSSVYHHLVSPLTQGLFCQAISESGTSYNNWAISAPGEGRGYAVKLLAALGGKGNTSTKEAVEFLKAKEPNEVVSALESLREWQIDPICTFKPVFEKDLPGAFLTWPLSKWVHKSVPLLIGMTSAEGLFRTEYFSLFPTDYKWYSDNFDRLGPLSLTYELTSTDPQKVTNAIRNFYFPNGEINGNLCINLSKMYTDGLFSVGILEGANKHPGNTYFYYFDYLGEHSFSGHRDKRNPSIHYGASHTDEMIYLFKQLYPRYLDDLKGEDLELSLKLVKLWTNFVKYGCPTANSTDLRWDLWTKDKHQYLYIGNDGIYMKEGLLEEEYDLWKNTPFRDVLDK